MRCPKCQYLGFEPSPRCKNCGYDFSFGEDTGTLTLVADPEAPPAMADFDLQILDDAPKPATGRRTFDLDELLASGRSASDPAPVTLELHQPAAAPVVTATSVAVSSTPPPEEVERIVREAARVFDEPEPVVAPVAPVAAPAEAVVADAPVIAAALAVEPVPPRAVFGGDEPPAPVVPPPATVTEPEPEPVPVPVAPRVARPVAPVTTELPLFMQGMNRAPVIEPAPEAASTPAVEPLPVTTPPAAKATSNTTTAAESPSEGEDDTPLVRVPARPRAPLSVRRTTPDAAAMRAKYARPLAPTSGDLLRDIETATAPPPVDAPAVDRPAARLSAEPTPSSLPAEWLAGAPTTARLSAAAIDVVLLGAINALVVWLTLSVCGLTAADANLLPIVPLAVFFVVLDGGYLVLFTAACGQTLGKMAAGIRVVGMTTGAVINDRLSIGQAFARAIGAMASVLPLGAGFWMALVGDHRALHDRVAHTRVVRA